MVKKLLLGLVLFVVAACALTFFLVLPASVERRLNPIHSPAAGAVSQRARDLHARLLIADLHADSLLWGRDLLERGARGHVDVPRLIEGNVALQAFTVVTKSPRGLNIERNAGDTDNIIWLALAGRWPAATWGSLRERALYQARRLHETAARSGGRLTLIRTKSDLSQYLERRRRSAERITAGFLGLEGAHALEGDAANVDLLSAAGFRMMSPAHFFDTEMGGSAHGLTKGGLTAEGRAMIGRMEARGVLVDLAHASPRTIDDVLAIATRALVVSHTGVRGTCDNTRNLSDEHVRAIARTGGVIGIGYWETATCGRDARAIARAVRYAADLTSVAHVGLGSDFDGAITAPFDTTELVRITDALLAEGFDDAEVEMIMGGNVIRLLAENLPDQ